MKKVILTLFFLLLVLGAVNFDAASAAVDKYKASYQQTVVKGAVGQYRSGNYVGAAQELLAILKEEPNNTYAKYYLALCYTKLGYKEKANEIYKDITENSTNTTLVHYSQKAIDCIGNPDSSACNPSSSSQTTEDMTKFIQSGQKIHPAAMDKITNDRMERELERNEYVRKQNLNQKSEAPTNEEIAQALNVLSKAGLNPYQVNPYTALMNNGFSNQMGYNPYLYTMMQQNNNPETAKMLLYSQMMGTGMLSGI